MARGVFAGVGIDRRKEHRVGHRHGGRVRGAKTKSRWAVVRLLEELRVARAMTRDDLADISGYHRMIIGRYERGETTPSLKALVDLANALGCDVTLAPKLD